MTIKKTLSSLLVSDAVFNAYKGLVVCGIIIYFGVVWNHYGFKHSKNQPYSGVDSFVSAGYTTPDHSESPLSAIAAIADTIAMIPAFTAPVDTSPNQPSIDANDQRAILVSKVVSKWSVDYDDADYITNRAFHYGKVNGVDPVLVLAIIGVESSFKQKVVSHAGASGLMQVMPILHKKRIRSDIFEIDENMRVGTQILSDCMASAKTLKGALARYNGSSHDGPYPVAVLRVRDYLDKPVATTAASSSTG